MMHCKSSITSTFSRVCLRVIANVNLLIPTNYGNGDNRCQLIPNYQPGELSLERAPCHVNKRRLHKSKTAIYSLFI